MSALVKLYQVCNYFQPTRRTKYDFKSIRAASSRCLQSGIMVTVSFKTCTYQCRIAQGQILSTKLPPFLERPRFHVSYLLFDVVFVASFLFHPVDLVLLFLELFLV